MVVLELEHVEIDSCTVCGGIWLDRGELELLNGAALPVCPGKKSDEKKRRCPVCAKKMEKVWYAAGSDICVDRCNREHGVWFDKGELESLLEKNHTAQSERVVHLLRDMFRHRYFQKKEEAL